MVKTISRTIFNSLGVEVSRKRSGESVVSRRSQRGTSVKHLYELIFRFGVSEDFFFVTVGANDGVTNDPLFPHIKQNRLTGVMCEPHPLAFEKLERSLDRFPNVTPRQVALSETAQDLVLYCLNDVYSERYWATGNNPLGISSLKREHVVSQIRQKLGFSRAEALDAVNQVVVPGKTLSEIVAEENIERINLLQIDIEGMDHIVLKMIDPLSVKPEIVVFENKHCPDSVLEDVLRNMRNNGYRFLHLGSDTFCVLSCEKE